MRPPEASPGNPGPAGEAAGIIEPRRGKRTPALPPLALLAATEPDMEALERLLGYGGGSARRLFTGRLLTGSETHPGAALAGPMIGSPLAAMIAETLIAWGSRTLIFLGWCGAIAPGLAAGDLLLPEAAFIDEGTSRHYLPGRDASAPSAALLAALAAAAAGAGPRRGPVWTTDAPFRETPAKVLAFRERGALAVEMECSALFTVAAFRGAAAAALLVVSDELASLTWRPGFKSPRFAAGRAAAADALARLAAAAPAAGGAR
jgi:purine-nucleoside phosphorylase